jgi:hypothetical protein
MNYVRERLEKAERLLARNRYRRALAELDLATMNLNHTSSRDDVDRLEQLLDEVARGASGRLAERALRLEETAHGEITRRIRDDPPHVPAHLAATPVPPVHWGRVALRFSSILLALGLLIPGAFLSLLGTLVLVGGPDGEFTASDAAKVLLLGVSCLLASALLLFFPALRCAWKGVFGSTGS